MDKVGTRFASGKARVIKATVKTDCRIMRPAVVYLVVIWTCIKKVCSIVIIFLPRFH